MFAVSKTDLPAEINQTFHLNSTNIFHKFDNYQKMSLFVGTLILYTPMQYLTLKSNHNRV